MSFKVEVLIGQHSLSSLHKCQSVPQVGYVFLSRREGGAVKAAPWNLYRTPNGAGMCSGGKGEEMLSDPVSGSATRSLSRAV